MKSMHFDLKTLSFFLFIALVLVFTVVPSASAGGMETGHPYMLFHNISEVPGYQYRTLDPWRNSEAVILRDASGSLSLDFSGNLGAHDRAIYRGPYARDLGFAYQITKDIRYAQKAKEALLNLETGTTYSKIDRALALGSYSLAYDFVQPTFDSANDTIIRDKLATLADSTYKDLNDNGTNRGYVTFADYHGVAYPMVGMAGAALADYTNPNHLTLSSTPEDWHKAGTDYLFVDDKLHSYGRSLFSFGFDEVSGKHLNGAYKSYVIDSFMWWLQVYNHAYNENPFDKYPAAKRAFTSELWESLPNGYGNNYVTSGNLQWTYLKGFVNLLDEETKSNVLNYDYRLSQSTILPYTRSLDGVSGIILYCCYGNYSATQRSYPNTTSHLDKNAIYQVFRGSWNEDANWLSLVTWNYQSNSNRDMAHNDQASFEYYSRGDLLLADAGEDKYVLDRNYGTVDIHHNVITLEDPRTPFAIAGWSNSRSRGAYKGDAGGVYTPVNITSIIQAPWIEGIDISEKISSVVSGGFGQSQALSSPINHERVVLYPDNDYFIIVDRMEGTQPWVFRNIFRPTSLMITPTVDTNKDGVYAASEVGHVNGALTIGSTPYNWQALAHKAETSTGITTGSITWTTKNPYGKDVRLNLYSSPASEILVEKNVGRIGGYDATSEVYSPLVWFRTPQTTAEYRVTALLSSYSNEEAKTANQLAVTGTGHALNVHSSATDDYIYTGKGNSTFATFTTDADTAFIRRTGQTTEFTLLAGSSLKEGSNNLVTVSKKLDYFTFKQEGKTINFKVKGQNTADINLYNINPKSIKRDGIPYNNWIMQNNNTVLKISTDLGEHEFEISTDDILQIIPLMDQSVNERSMLTFTVNAVYTGTGVPVFSATNLPKNATFNAGSRIFTWTPVIGESGHFEPMFRVTDGTLSDSETVVITVTPAEEYIGDTVGIYRNGVFYLRNSNNVGNADLTFGYGIPGDKPLVGDWTGSGKDTVGIYRNGVFYLRNGNSVGNADLTFGYGIPGDKPLVGDWTGSGKDTVGIYRNGVFYLRNGNSAGNADLTFGYGLPTDTPVIGDWNGDGIDTVGVYRNGVFYLRNSNSAGNADLTFGYGLPTDTPVIGA